MCLSYTITFLLLSAEMVTFCVLVAPLPYSVRKRLLRFLSENPLIAKLAYALKITFMCVILVRVSPRHTRLGRRQEEY